MHSVQNNEKPNTSHSDVNSQNILNIVKQIQNLTLKLNGKKRNTGTEQGQLSTIYEL
jgi:hypothetical protein